MQSRTVSSRWTGGGRLGSSATQGESRGRRFWKQEPFGATWSKRALQRAPLPPPPPAEGWDRRGTEGPLRKQHLRTATLSTLPQTQACNFFLASLEASPAARTPGRGQRSLLALPPSAPRGLPAQEACPLKRKERAGSAPALLPPLSRGGAGPTPEAG